MSRSLTACAVLAVAGLLAWSRSSDPAPTPKAEVPLAVKLQQRVQFDGIDDNTITLGEVLDKLAEKYNLAFDLNEKAFRVDGIADVLAQRIATNPLPKMKNVRLETLLHKVLGRVEGTSGATLNVRRDAIEITTNKFQSEEVWGVTNGPRLPLVHQNFAKRLLEDALKDLAEDADFNIVLDARAAEQSKTAISARFSNTPLDTAVRLLAEMAGLRSVHIDNVLFVTTKENAEELESRLEKEKAKERMGDDQPAPLWRKGSGTIRTPADLGNLAV
jgi:hypothetical protein